MRQSTIAMIPAKLGSTRLKSKNLAYIRGRPMIFYAIEAAKKSGIFDRIIINAEDACFKKIADRYGVEFYKRPDSIVRPDTKTDTVVYDFLKHYKCDIVAWVSPIAPLQTGQEVRDIIRFFLDNRLDSLMTVKNEQVHCVYRGRPVNYSVRSIFSQTQDITPVQSFVYTLMAWRSDTFIRTFKRKGYALLCGKTGYFPVKKLSAFIVKTKDDLMLADLAMRAVDRDDYKVKYDPLLGRVRDER